MEAPRRDVIQVVLPAALVVLAQVDGPRRDPPGVVVPLDEPDGVFCSDCGEYKVPNEDGRCPDCLKNLLES